MAVSIERGQFVCAADGEALGNVACVESESFLVENGSPSAPALVCRLVDIADVRNGGIRLSRMRAQLHHDPVDESHAGAAAAQY